MPKPFAISFLDGDSRNPLGAFTWAFLTANTSHEDGASGTSVIRPKLLRRVKMIPCAADTGDEI